MTKTTLLVAIVGAAMLMVPVQADAQVNRAQPTITRTIKYIKSKLRHVNVHYYSASEAGLPRAGRRVNVVSINVSRNGRLELVTETSAAPNYLPSHRYKVVMCLSEIARVSSDASAAGSNNPRDSRHQPYEFLLICKTKNGKRRRCVESHWMDSKDGKSVRMFSEHRIRVSKQDERQGPKLLRAFEHLRKLHSGKTCRRDREPF